MSRFISRISTVAVLALAGLPALGLASAAHASSTPRAKPVVLARVAVGDLDLSRPEQARLLRARIDAAGLEVCDARVRAERLDRFSAKACRLDIEDEVQSKLSRAQLRALRAAAN